MTLGGVRYSGSSSRIVAGIWVRSIAMALSEQSLPRHEIKKNISQHADLRRWQLLDRIGHGGSGDVYKASDLTGILGLVAVKRIRKIPGSHQVSISFYLAKVANIKTNVRGP